MDKYHRFSLCVESSDCFQKVSQQPVMTLIKALMIMTSYSLSIERDQKNHLVTMLTMNMNDLMVIQSVAVGFAS